MIFILITVSLLASVCNSRPQGRTQNADPRPLTYGSPYGLDLQYDFSLLDPQLQYPGYPTQPRLQPQVIYYTGGAPGQPFLLQPAGHPGNFLIPQPQPGFVLRDSPQPNPVFVQGQPKPFVPPINKDAEEIPTGPSLTAQGVQGKTPEKLESFGEGPEFSSGEAEVLAAADRTQNLKPGQRFFILNGQPLFSNYPLPQFSNSPYQPTPERYGQDLYYKQSPSFPQDDFIKPYQGETPRPRPALDVRFNELDFNQNFFGLHQKNANNKVNDKVSFKLRPIKVPDEENSSEEIYGGKDLGKFDSYKDDLRLKATEKSRKDAVKEESISQAEPGAIALAGPGGVASAAPRGTALSGTKGLSVSSPKATAIAGPAKEKEQKPSKIKKEKQ
nr:uncharacterized protein LOC111424700 [Onthophagus taurus]